MVELEFSVMAASLEAGYALRPLLDDFERQTHIKVNFSVFTWETGWSDIMKIALYGHGPDVSELGTTWIGSIASMNALRSFSGSEIRSLGGEGAFLKDSWATGLVGLEQQVWSIPWLVDTRAMYFRRDWLQRVGQQDEKGAFQTAQALAATLESLQKMGVATPWSGTVTRSPNVLHEAASWIWGAGGDFITRDGKQVLFNQPEAMQGLKTYFELRKYLSPAHIQAGDSMSYFQGGQAACVIVGPHAMLQAVPDESRQRWGIAQVPGVPFLGGSNLVIWKHSRQPEAALELIRFLSSLPAHFPASPHGTMLPARYAQLETLSNEGDASMQGFVAASKAGRTYLSTRLWGLVEENLVSAFSHTWTQLLEDPFLEVEQALHRNLDPLARRLNFSLSN
jgi:multiple sugar transport system substrate-binding protein